MKTQPDKVPKTGSRSGQLLIKSVIIFNDLVHHGMAVSKKSSLEIVFKVVYLQKVAGTFGFNNILNNYQKMT